MGHLTTMSATLLKEYVSKPISTLAVQITDENAKDVATMVGGKLYPRTTLAPLRIYFHCCNGRMKAEWGDWILRDSKGFHAMTNSEFTESHERKS